MKLRTTTPVSKSLLTRSVLVVATIIFAIATPIQISQSVSADKYDDQIAALQQAVSNYQAQADILNSQAATLQNALAQLANDKAALQAQIDVNQAKYNQLVAQIADTEKKIKDSQDALGTTIANLYVDSSVTPLELVASSKNISDFLDKQEYRNSVRDQLTSAIAQIKTLKAQLDQQKVDTQKVLADQQSAKNDLVTKENEQQNLLSKTNNSEAAYQSMISSSLSKIAAAKAAQAEMAARAKSTGGYSVVSSGSLSEYTALWAPNSCTMGGAGGWQSYGGADGNGGDGRGYGCRQCASYVAWKIATVTGKYYQWGNGGNFANAAIKAGYQDLGHNPDSGSIAVMWGDPGHVAWVEKVAGNQVLVSQYNWQINGQYGIYSEMWVSSTVFDQYVKIK